MHSCLGYCIAQERPLPVNFLGSQEPRRSVCFSPYIGEACPYFGTDLRDRNLCQRRCHLCDFTFLTFVMHRVCSLVLSIYVSRSSMAACVRCVAHRKARCWRMHLGKGFKLPC